MLQSRTDLAELRLKGASFNGCRVARGGRHSAATLCGTAWLTADRCDGTLTTARRGKVAVRDLRRRRTITVRAGKSYLARAPG